jgi:hypothetical protein
MSWALTFSAVCVGYVFFRANTVQQAFAMLEAMVSFSTYRHLTLDRSLYLMTFLASVGYFAVVGAGELLNRWGESARARARNASFAWLSNLVATLAEERWVWITPILLVGMLYLSVIFQPGRAETSVVMYALF